MCSFALLSVLVTSKFVCTLPSTVLCCKYKYSMQFSYSMSSYDGDQGDSLDIKPPQAVVQRRDKREKREKKDRHRHKAERHKERHRNREHRSHEEKRDRRHRYEGYIFPGACKVMVPVLFLRIYSKLS